MSSMIKKKGSLAFKPKALQSRRQPGPALSVTPSTRQSTEQQSQTPAPTARAKASPPPPVLTQQQDVSHRPPLHQDTIPVEELVPELLLRAPEDTRFAGTIGNINLNHTEKSHNIEDSVQITAPLDRTIATVNDGVSTPCPVPATAPNSLTLKPPAMSLHASEFTDSNVSASQSLVAPGNVDLPVQGLGESDLAEEVVPATELNPNGTFSSSAASPLSEKITKRPSKRRKLGKNGIDATQSTDVLINKTLTRPRRPRKARDNNGKRKRGKQREETPEGAEEQEVDHSTVKMSDLTQDLRIGKKFSRHVELKKRQMEKRTKLKPARGHLDLVEDQPTEDEPPTRIVRPQEEHTEASAGPQMRIVNGQIVIDDTSLVVDRHAAAAAAAAEMEEIEEDEFTRVTTCGTFMKRERNLHWDPEATEKFYMGLRMFGTDFEMISKMFPDRTRRQIKLKFNKEERESPKRISSALIGETVKIDLEEYKLHTGLEYEATDDIKAEHAQIEADHKAEQRRMQAQVDETMRQKKAEIQGKVGKTKANPAISGASTNHGTAEDSAKENRSETVEGGKARAASTPKKKQAGKKRGRNLNSSRGLGGEEVEVLGTIDVAHR